MGLSSWSLDHIAFSWRVIPKAFRIKDPWESWNYQYTGGQNMLAPPNGLSGSSGGRITVRALHDGGVVIDGQYGNDP
ncbi:MAG TPA: hypothetical protein VM783_00760, partial [Candidatus Acidoferrum sp.]|nr:hypothetical protein [Candidatus Acidoferrum sp.]